MKRTAVEWLIEELTKNGHNFKLYKKEINQAKEMEKQQNYSEEEVLEIIKKLHIEIGFQFTNEIKEWVNKQFKNE